MMMNIQGRKDTLRVALETLKVRAALAVVVVEEAVRIAVVEGIKIEEDITESPAIEDQDRDLTPGVEAIDHIDMTPLIVSIVQGLGIVPDLEKGSIHVSIDLGLGVFQGLDIQNHINQSQGVFQGLDIQNHIDLDQGVFQGLGTHKAALPKMVIPSLG